MYTVSHLFTLGKMVTNDETRALFFGIFFGAHVGIIFFFLAYLIR